MNDNDDNERHRQRMSGNFIYSSLSSAFFFLFVSFFVSSYSFLMVGDVAAVSHRARTHTKHNMQTPHLKDTETVAKANKN